MFFVFFLSPIVPVWLSVSLHISVPLFMFLWVRLYVFCLFLSFYPCVCLTECLFTCLWAYLCASDFVFCAWFLNISHLACVTERMFACLFACLFVFLCLILCFRLCFLSFSNLAFVTERWFGCLFAYPFLFVLLCCYMFFFVSLLTCLCDKVSVWMSLRLTLWFLWHLVLTKWHIAIANSVGL